MKQGFVIFMMLVLVVALAGCSAFNNNQSAAQQSAQNLAANRATYVVKNDVDGGNYYKRLSIADDPTTILWCTWYPTTVGSAPITFSIVGKMTSSGKRPFPINTCGEYTCENPDAQGMYGTSDAYVYGFGPAGEYMEVHDWGFCTNLPTTYQATTIMFQGTDPGLQAATDKARTLLAAGDAAGAQAVLDAAIKASGGK
jgi:uncharacterized protein YceK